MYFDWSRFDSELNFAQTATAGQNSKQSQMCGPVIALALEANTVKSQVLTRLI